MFVIYNVKVMINFTGPISIKVPVVASLMPCSSDPHDRALDFCAALPTPPAGFLGRF